MAASNASTRPTLNALHQPSAMLRPAAVTGSRSIFIQTENTPNPDALKFLPNHPILPPGLSSPFLEYLNPRATLAPPHPSPLAAQLMNIDGITSVFYGADFITVTKAADANWAHVKPEVFSLITEAVTSGAQIVNITESKSGEQGQDGGEEDSLSYNENDSEVVGMIKELLETRIRPAIQEDGGDIEFRGFEEGMVLLKLRGACRTCDSSTVTLKNGIEGMLMHYVSHSRAQDLVDRADKNDRLRRSKVSLKSLIRRRRLRLLSSQSLRRSSDCRKVLMQRLPPLVKDPWIRCQAKACRSIVVSRIRRMCLNFRRISELRMLLGVSDLAVF